MVSIPNLSWRLLVSDGGGPLGKERLSPGEWGLELFGVLGLLSESLEELAPGETEG